MKKGGFHTEAPVHDPAVFLDKDGSYYIFGTHMSAAVSKDLRYWNCFASGVNAENPLFVNLFDDEKKAFSFCGKFNGKEYAVWAPDGPFVDMEGKTFRRVNHHDPYGLKLMGNYIFPSMEYGYKSPGHNSAFIDSDGKMYIVYHQRFDVDSEMHEPRVHQLFRTKNGWLTVAPFATEGEMLCSKSYLEAEICGIYYVIEHGQDISSKVKKPVKVEFTRDNKIICAETTDGKKDKKLFGSYRLEDESRITVTIGKLVYECVIVQINDEAGNPTMCITGVGSNQSIWAVRYL